MKKQLFALILAGTAMAPAWAVPARRGFVDKTDINGRHISVQLVGDEFGHYYTDPEGREMLADENGNLYYATSEKLQAVKQYRTARYEARNALRKNMRMAPGQVGKFPGASFPATGKQKAIVVLVEYKDVKFTLSSDHDVVYNYFHDMLNKDGFNQYGGTGSAHEYFIDSSKGQFDCDFDVYGPVTLSQNRSYYGGNDYYGNDKAPEEMVVEACKALDSEVNFKDYDRDGDGYVDNVFVIYAGQGEASYGSSNTVWPHAWDLGSAGKAFKLDGVTISSYGCSNEWESNAPDGVGTFVHEFSHVIGLPDLYHTESSSANYTPGSWSVLDYGPYNNNGRTPPAYSTFERNAMGWMTPTELTAESGDVILSELNYSNEAFSITNPKNSGEFYLIESRQKKGWDKYIPYTGVLIWHIDYNTTTWYNNAVNNTQSHQGVDLIEADGKPAKTTRTGGDCFPGTSRVTEYSPKWWDKSSVGFDITEIKLTTDGGAQFTVKNTSSSSGNNNGGEDNNGDFYTVSNVINGDAGGTGCVVRGYIVGWVQNWSANGIYFTAQNCKLSTNVLLADSPDERDTEKVMPVQLPSGEIRKAVNLMDNPSNLGRYIEFTGNATQYFNVPGLKNPTAYRFIEPTAIEDIRPDATDVTGAPIYDLQGRRVANPVAGHIYIRAGRKFRL